jgi:hypothetical protein
LFELTGPKAIRVIGLYTGAVYTFAKTGAQQLIHGADAAAVAKVPALRPVRPTGAVSGHATAWFFNSTRERQGDDYH